MLLTEATGELHMWRPAAVPEILRVVHLDRQPRTLTTYSEGYALVAVTEGRYEGWYRGAVHTHAAGQVSLKEPGEVYRAVRVHEPFSVQIAAFSPEAIARVAETVGVRGSVQFRVVTLDPPAPAVGSVFAMHAALARASASALELGTRVSEALAEVILAAGTKGTTARRDEQFPRAVRRARELLHESFAGAVTLDALAEHAGLDKFHLVRAFRAAVGLPPYAYLTHVRVERAAALLVRGASVAEAAQAVGFYDESQLHRHFRRLMQITPGRFARSIGGAGHRLRQHRPSRRGDAGVTNKA
jgi:AraC-like DNA-binding protein